MFVAINDELSSVAGWMSIACWIVVYSPQIYENYRLKSGEGLSVPFVVIWLLGDLCNLVGAVLARLLPTVIILAVYYSVCDMILLSQVFYYRRTHPTHVASAIPTLDEQAPLLQDDLASDKPESSTLPIRRTIVYILALLFVIGTGVAAWQLNKSDSEPNVHAPGREEDIVEWRSQLIGWCSAVLYLGSRIPQIMKNRQTKCEGLSLALFVFAVAGNVTYVFSICVKSMEWKHIVANSSWLAGSGLTVFLDFMVLGQFFYYRRERSVMQEDTPVLDIEDN